MSFYLSQSLLFYWRQTCGQNPAKKLYTTDASPSDAGGFFASITREDWLSWYDLAEEKLKHVRLDWKGEEPPSDMHDVRAAAEPLALKLKWTTLFSYRFLAGQHIKLLELESRDVSRGRWSSRQFNFLLQKLGFWCLACDIALELVWVPTWANPVDAPSRNKRIECWYSSLPELPATPPAVLASAPALSELNLLREALSVAAHSAKEHVRKLESSGAFSCSDDWRDGKSRRDCWPDAPIFMAPSWFNARLGLTLPTGASPDYWRIVR